ncbi:MAG: hypothetical protein ACI4R8_00700 [Candidatus Caccovivens sp.]
MTIDIDSEGKMTQEWIDKNISNNDWNAGYVAFDLGKVTMFISKDREISVYSCKIVEKHKGFWIVQTNNEKKLFIGKNKNGVEFLPEKFLSIVDNIYQSPLTLKDITIEDIFNKSDYDYNKLIYAFNSIVSVGFKSFNEQKNELDKQRLDLYKQLDDLEKQQNNPYKYVQLVKLNNVINDYNDSVVSLRNNSNEYDEIIDFKKSECLEFIEDKFNNKVKNEPKYLS